MEGKGRERNGREEKACKGEGCVMAFRVMDIRVSEYDNLHCVSKKHVTLFTFEHNSNINCPIIIIFGTVVTETISY